MTFNLAQIRNETPGIAGNGIHLDNAGSSLMSAAVIRVMKDWLDLESRLGGYRAAAQEEHALSAVYTGLAKMLGGAPSNFGLTSGGADAFARLFFSVPLGRGDNIVTSFNEYCSNYLAYLHQAQRKGFDIRVAPAGDNGQVDLNALESLVDERTRLVAVSHNTATSGLVLPAAEIGEICDRKGALFLLDATQSIGQMPVDLKDIGCHLATGTARKWLRGPRGTGFFYMSEEGRSRIDPALVYNQSGTWLGADDYELRSDAFVLEGWERSCMNQIGLGLAISEYQAVGELEVFAALQDRALRLRQGIKAVPGIRLVDPDAANSAIVTCNVDRQDAETAQKSLAALGFHVNVALKAHTLLDFADRNLDAVLRISPHYYTSIDEIDALLSALEEIAR